MNPDSVKILEELNKFGSAEQNIEATLAALLAYVTAEKSRVAHLVFNEVQIEIDRGTVDYTLESVLQRVVDTDTALLGSI